MKQIRYKMDDAPPGLLGKYFDVYETDFMGQPVYLVEMYPQGFYEKRAVECITWLRDYRTGDRANTIPDTLFLRMYSTGGYRGDDEAMWGYCIDGTRKLFEKTDFYWSEVSILGEPYFKVSLATRKI